MYIYISIQQPHQWPIKKNRPAQLLPYFLVQLFQTEIIGLQVLRLREKNTKGPMGLRWTIINHHKNIIQTWFM